MVTQFAPPFQIFMWMLVAAIVFSFAYLSLFCLWWALKETFRGVQEWQRNRRVP